MNEGDRRRQSIIPPMCDCAMELGKKLRSKKVTVERVRGERAGERRSLNPIGGLRKGATSDFRVE